VPNRHDPFLRPLMVAVMYRLGIYEYGYEKSFSRRALRRMLEAEGFAVQAESGILFIPGWLRLADLAVHRWLRPLAFLSRIAVAPFLFLGRRCPGLRRHGYLLATLATRPADTRPAGGG
jgi:hypothetical protein